VVQNAEMGHLIIAPEVIADTLRIHILALIQKAAGYCTHVNLW